MFKHNTFFQLKIVIEGTKGSGGARGDISIDDIQVTNGPCGQLGIQFLRFYEILFYDQARQKGRLRLSYSYIYTLRIDLIIYILFCNFFHLLKNSDCFMQIIDKYLLK